MADYTLNAEIRESTGKGAARKLRAAGRIPGICYGENKVQQISVDPKALDHLIRTSASGMNTLIDLKVTGGGTFDGKKFLLKEMQRDPVTRAPLHADFFAIDLTHSIDVAVPLHVRGTAPGVSIMGGILDQVLREIQLECLPNAIPDEVIVDVSELGLGESIHVRDLELPEGVKLLSDRDLSVVSVNAPKITEEEAPAEEAEAAAVEGAEAGGEAAASREEAEPSDEKSGD